MGKIESTYWWKDDLKKDKEYSFLVKTHEDNKKKVIERTKELHSYETPSIIFFKIQAGSKEYLDWIEKNTQEK